MKNKKWKWKIDQYFEDKIWSKIPEEHTTPHMFFMIGLITATILFFLIGLFL